MVGAQADALTAHVFLRGKAVVSKATDLFQIMYVLLRRAGGCVREDKERKEGRMT